MYVTVVLYSKAGCQKQAAHCDYEPSSDFAKCPRKLMPNAAIIALEDDTTIDVWPKSIGLSNGLATIRSEINRTTLELEKGDIFIFRGDLIHAGSRYEHDNVRIHTYLDSPVVPRDPNRTWIIHKHADPSIRKYIKS